MAGGSQSSQGSQGSSSQDENVTANATRLFQTPLHGLRNGLPVRILGVGDVPGHSPSYLTVDSQGKSTWEPFKNITVIDSNCAPLSAEYFENIVQSAQQSGRMSGTSR